MDLNLQWGDPLELRRSPSSAIYDVNVSEIPEAPGVYVFYRVHGDVKAALYVGKGENLQSRIRQQLNAVKLMKGIENALTGSRYLICANFQRKSGQQLTCLPIIERALIRYYLSTKEGDELLNIQGSRIKKHSLTSERPSSEPPSLCQAIRQTSSVRRAITKST